jgi:hypothetical protein
VLGSGTTAARRPRFVHSSAGVVTDLFIEVGDADVAGEVALAPFWAPVSGPSDPVQPLAGRPTTEPAREWRATHVAVAPIHLLTRICEFLDRLSGYSAAPFPEQPPKNP